MMLRRLPPGLLVAGALLLALPLLLAATQASTSGARGSANAPRALRDTSSSSGSEAWPGLGAPLWPLADGLAGELPPYDSAYSDDDEQHAGEPAAAAADIVLAQQQQRRRRLAGLADVWGDLSGLLSGGSSRRRPLQVRQRRRGG
jgi:hypothetical protein